MDTDYAHNGSNPVHTGRVFNETFGETILERRDLQP